MNKGWKSALMVLALAGTALSAPAVAQTYGPDTYGPPANPYAPQGSYGPQNNYPPQDNGYGNPNYAPDDPYAPGDPYAPPQADPYAQYPNYAPPGGIGFSYDSGGYCDAWGCPDDYWDMPIFYGPVFFGGAWYDGPVYYRDGYGGRQFWIHGGWHGDEWRGQRPGWWHAGRVGPALGLNFYQNHGFHGRADNRGRASNPGGVRAQFDNRQWNTGPGQRGNFAGRNVQQAAPQNNRGGGFTNFRGGQQQAAPQNNPGGGFMNFRGGQQQAAPQNNRGGGFMNFRGGQQQVQQQAAPQNNRGGGFTNFRGGQQQVQQQAPQSHGGNHDRGAQQASNGGGRGGGHPDGGHDGGDHHGHR